ncbi:hypothetical protein BW730_12070 [Tessaracoccus aquimaris]|uniref:Major facilitator superfamily (MFS) profile domain-containing protein n=1 Tax=Tessaracoccus aquimaris TaxID=1332264 RepID=A0A1Q2CQ08_9ACTN|nr:MFS transporter [Tessaracoccus aquimaris]AQP48120.1 hypothetical protein BW730_12070 [Tessaracoccus aquimaris]
MPTARYAVLQSTYWSGFCLIVSFASVYLLAQGLSNSEIGILIAVASALATVLQPLVAGVADRSRWPLRLWIVASGILMAALAVALLVPGQPRLLVAITYGVLVGSIQIVQPLVNSVGMDAINLGIRLNFGLARACASLTFALLSLAAGRIVESTSSQALPVLMIAMQVLFVASAATFVFRRPAPHRDEEVAPEPVQEPEPLDRAAWMRFGLVLAGFTLAMASHNVLNGFMFQVVTFHGGTASDMGLAVMIAALTELPTMIGFNRLVRRWTPGVLMIVAGVGFAVKSIATYLAPNLAGIYAAQALQFAAFGLIVPASVYYVNRHFPPSQRVTGQAYMTMTATAGSVIGSVVGGVVLDVAGVPTMLLLGAVFGVLGAGCMAVGSNRS